MSDSVSSDQNSGYEDIVRDSLRTILWGAFKIYAREPNRGFSASFKKSESSGNLWWVGRSANEKEIQIDYLAHTTPLTMLRDVDERAVADIPHVMVFKSRSMVPAAAPRAPVLAAVQRLLSESPEKPDDEAPDDIGEFVQYIVGEITHGGERSVGTKLNQLEKDCTFLTSRAQPQVTRVADLRVLDVVAVAVVASPSVKSEKVFNYVRSNRLSLPMLSELFSAGRLVCVKDERTTTVLLRDMKDSFALFVDEQREDRDRVAAELREERRIAAEDRDRLAAELRVMFQSLASYTRDFAPMRVASGVAPESSALPLPPTSPAGGHSPTNV